MDGRKKDSMVIFSVTCVPPLMLIIGVNDMNDTNDTFLIKKYKTRINHRNLLLGVVWGLVWMIFNRFSTSFHEKRYFGTNLVLQCSHRTP